MYHLQDHQFVPRAQLQPVLPLRTATAEPWSFQARTTSAWRKSWDRALARLRERLREAGLREDLVRPDGRGNVELFLRPGDQVVDEA